MYSNKIILSKALKIVVMKAVCIALFAYIGVRYFVPISTALAIASSPSNSPMLVSITPLGVQANGNSYKPSVSFDGRYVAFESVATNLVANDTNLGSDIFVRDMVTHEIQRASVNSAGVQSKGSSYSASISGDGRYVVFQSSVSNLVLGDTNGKRDIFVRDLQGLATTRVSIDSLGIQSNGNSYRSAISFDGRYVAFESDATNLVTNDTNLKRDIFIHDRQTGVTERASINSDGTQGNTGTLAFSLSGDGRYVAFESAATNLVAGDTNGVRDIFVHDRNLGITTRATVSPDGVQSNGAGTENPSLDFGRYVSFESYATNLVLGDTNGIRDIFVRDLQTGAISRATVSSEGVQAADKSEYSSLNSDGRYVVFRSKASNLAEGVTLGLGYIYLRDFILNTTNLVISNPAGPLTDADTNFIPRISGDGRYVVFESTATTLINNDVNGFRDIFIIPMGPPPPPDETAPSIPTDLVAVVGSSSQIDLSWTASLDNVGIAGYNVYRAGILITTTPGTNFFDTGLAASTTYAYTVSAFDAAGNSSAQTTAVSVTTQAPPPPDTTSPSIPALLTASTVSSSQINLNWSASTDDREVTGYIIYRNGVQVATTTQTSHSDMGLAPLTTYSYTVSAFDAAGNNSAQSISASATTPEQLANKNLLSPVTALDKDFRYNDGVTGAEDSVAVWEAPDPANSLLFITHKSANKVTVWSLVTQQIIHTLTGFNTPNGAVVDQIEDMLYVADRRNNAIKKYFIPDIAAGNLLPTLIFGTGFTPSSQPMGITVYHERGISYIYATYVGSTRKYVRAFKSDGTFYTQWNTGTFALESIKADDRNHVIYVSDETNELVKVYQANSIFVRDFGVGIFGGTYPDPEGITIYECQDDGYIIISNQGLNQFEIFDRKTFQHLATFKINVALDTDGITITQVSLPQYPQGGFFAQSRDQYVEGITWNKIADATGMSICSH